MKKLLTVILIFVMLMLGACSSGEQVTGTVKISDEIGVVLEAEVTVDVPATAKDAVIEACQNAKMAYTFDSGMFDGFDGKMSTMTDGWLFYVNGEQAQVGAADAELAEGFTVEFRYENYEEAFSM